MPSISYVGRKEHFSAAHRLHSPALSDEENRQLYGKCNHINGHGHNYEVEVIVRGTVDPRTGMVVNLVDLKGAIQNVLDILDHKNLDKDVPFFQTVPSTTENVAIFIWDILKQNLRLSAGSSLFEVKIHETRNNFVTYRGEEEPLH